MSAEAGRSSRHSQSTQKIRRAHALERASHELGKDARRLLTTEERAQMKLMQHQQEVEGLKMYPPDVSFKVVATTKVTH